MPFYLREVVTDLFYSLELLYSHLKKLKSYDLIKIVAVIVSFLAKVRI